ncbi:hypothetical protein [Georgenia satyanarayanai]|nr:hypothetical protein [Georgenia satyanarayanai]
MAAQWAQRWLAKIGLGTGVENEAPPRVLVSDDGNVTVNGSIRAAHVLDD